jgi:hypothetical protein
VTATAAIRGFEIEAVVVFAIVGAKVLRDAGTVGRLTPFGALFLGGLAVALIGDPIANWGLTALYSDQFFLLPRVFGLGLSPAQSWAVVFAYPWCFPMMAYAGRALARALGGRSALAGFLAGCVTGGTMFVLSVPMVFVPQQVIVYQRAPSALTLFAGTPQQVQLLDILGVTTFIGLFTAVLMPGPGESRFERRLPATSAGRAAFASAMLVGFFLLTFAPALAVRILGLDDAVGFATSPYPTVPLY